MSRNSAAFILAAVLLGSCASKQPPEIPIIIPDIPVEVPEVSVDRSDYVKSAWALAMINVNRLNTRELVESELSKARKYGLNEIWLEVKPSTGHALWQSEVLPRFESWGEQVVPEGYDYLGTVLEVAKEQGMEVIACVNTLGFACTQTHSGLLYEDPSWEGHTQAKLVDGAVVDIMDLDMPAEDGAMLEPSSPKVQDFVVSYIDELCANYPDLKGVCLDYCRYAGGDFGFSELAMERFRLYSGNNTATVSDIMDADGNKGPLYAQWIEFRSMTIHNLVERLSKTVHSHSMELILWASADWESRYLYGQNWASTEYRPEPSFVYTASYNKTGFAELLDAFCIGAYSSYLYADQSYYSVEGYMDRYPKYIKDATKVYGSFACYEYKNREDMATAVEMCLTKSEGLMVFDLWYLTQLKHWYGLYEGLQNSNALKK